MDSPAAARPARASAAKPAALEASPAAIGKLPRESTRTGPSARPDSARTRSSRASTRARSLPRASPPWSVTASAGAPNSTVVTTSSGARVTERLDWCGRMRTGSRFPQYFTSAMLGWARAVAREGLIRGAPARR